MARTAKKAKPAAPPAANKDEPAAEWVPLDRIHPWPDNPRKDQPVEAVAASIKEFGFGAPIVARKANGEIIKGHTRYKAAQKLGLERVPVRFLDVTEEQAHRLAAVDNRLGEVARWDEQALRRLLEPLADSPPLGFDSQYVTDLLASTDGARVWSGNKPVMTPLADLKPHPRNYRAHPDDQVEHLAESIRANGFYRAVIAARDGTILVGHGIAKAAAKCGLTSVPVSRLNLDPLEARALKLLAGDNESGHLAEVDDRRLSEILKEVMESDVKLVGTGYDPAMLSNLIFVTRPATEIRDKNAAAEWTGMPEYDDGERTGSPLQLVITFKSEGDRAEFVKQAMIRVDKKESKTWSTRWPFTVREDAHSIRFESKPSDPTPRT